MYLDPRDLTYFEPGSTLWADDRPLTVEDLRRGKRGHEVLFREISDRTEAEVIRNLELFASERRELAPGEYWSEQLIGLVVRPGGGLVVGVESGALQDRLVIERGGRRYEVPFVDAWVPVVDVEGGYVEVAEIDGLMEPPDSE